TLTYVWTVNGDVVKTTTNTADLTDTLDLGVAGNGDAGDVVAVTVTPNNGILDGAPATASTTVADTPPTATAILAPASPATDQAVPPTATAADLDGDIVTLTYVWKRNGEVIQTTADTTALTDSLDLGVQDRGDEGDTISVEVTPYDGTDHGST